MFRFRPLRRGDKGPEYGPMVKTIRDWLKQLQHYHPSVDESIEPEFDVRLEEAVISFQEENGLFADGVVGPLTMTALEEAIRIDAIEQTSFGIGTLEPSATRRRFIQCRADPFKILQPGESSFSTIGYDHLWLRDDAAEAYQTVYEKVKKLGGLLTCSGGRRSLYTPVSHNMSAMSFHYLGLALDLNPYSAMYKPESDPCVVTLKEPYAPLSAKPIRFEVFVRCEPERVEETTLQRVVTYDDPTLMHTTTGPFANLTEMFGKAGFLPIPARSAFMIKKRKSSAEWWHFQYEKSIEKGVSTFGGELLRVYPREQLVGTTPWKYKDRVFGIDWSTKGEER